jgi:hypothetical protein
LRNERFNVEINYGEDALLNINLLKKIKKICIVDSILYFYRKNPNSLTYTHRRKYSYWKNEIDGYVKLLEETVDYNAIEFYDKIEFIKGMILGMCLKGAVAIIREKRTKDELKKIQKILRQYVSVKNCTNNRTKILFFALKWSAPIFCLLMLCTNIKNKKKMDII